MDESGFGMKVVLDECGFGMKVFRCCWMKVVLGESGHGMKVFWKKVVLDEVVKG